MECGEFHPKYSAELLEHVDKQNEVLVETYNSMLQELQKIRVEEEMLMRKLYEVFSARGLTKQNDCNTNNSNSSAGAEHSEHSNEEVNAAHKEQ